MTLFYNRAVICGLYNNQLVPIVCNAVGQIDTTTGDFTTNVADGGGGTINKAVLVAGHGTQIVALQCTENGELIS